MLTRRSFVVLGAAAGLAACTTRSQAVTRAAATVAPESIVPATPPMSAVPLHPPLPAFYGALEGEPYPVPAVPDAIIPPELWRQTVANPWPRHPQGTIVVDPDAAILHFVENSARAVRYGVSVGAEGFGWSGTARLQFSRAWPRWKVPQSTIARQPELEKYSVANGGMAPGPGNPMGARALYLFQDGIDTLYRVHGGAKARDLGQAVSAGCIRMLDQDVIDLHRRSVHGASVIVLPSLKPEGIGGLF